MAPVIPHVPTAKQMAKVAARQSQRDVNAMTVKAKQRDVEEGRVTMNWTNAEAIDTSAAEDESEFLMFTAWDLLETIGELVGRIEDDSQANACMELIRAVQSDRANVANHSNGNSTNSTLRLRIDEAPEGSVQLMDVIVKRSQSNLANVESTSSSSAQKRASEVQIEEPEIPEQVPFFPAASHGDFRARLFLLFEDASKSTCGKFITIVVMLTIAVSTCSFLMETMPDYKERPPECHELRDAGLPLTVKACEPVAIGIFAEMEVVCIIIFTIDYIVRVSTVHAYKEKEKVVRPKRASALFITPETIPISSVEMEKRGESGLSRTLAYMKTPLNLIDFSAIVPFYIELAIGGGDDGNGDVIRVLRLLRVLRIMKMGKNNAGMQIFAEVFVMSAPTASILMFFNVIGTILFGALIFFAEGTTFTVADDLASDFPTGVHSRDDFSGEGIEPTPFRSIPMGSWWAMTTMTTVGYGDMYPTTKLGKLVGVLCFYVGVILIAMPIIVLGSNFEIVYAKNYQKPDEDSADDSGSKKNFKKRAQSDGDLKPWIPSCPGIKKKIFIILEDPDASKLGKGLSLVIIATILVSTVLFIFETMPAFNQTPEDCDANRPTAEDCEPRPAKWFATSEAICIAIFTADYVCKALTVHTAEPHECGLPENREYTGLSTTWKYETNPMNIIDVLAIIPFYIELIAGGGGGGGLAVLRILRLVRVFRVLRMPKLRSGVAMFGKVVIDSIPALSILIFMSFLGCVMFSSCMFFAEGTSFSVTHFPEDYPDGTYIRPTLDGHDVEPSPWRSIPHAFWWFFTTATTVGYGDYYPTTTIGRFIGIFAFYAGIVLLALPTTILGGAFTEHYPKWAEENDIGGCSSTRRSTRTSFGEPIDLAALQSLDPNPPDPPSADMPKGIDLPNNGKKPEDPQSPVSPERHEGDENIGAARHISFTDESIGADNVDPALPQFDGVSNAAHQNDAVPGERQASENEVSQENRIWTI